MLCCKKNAFSQCRDGPLENLWGGGGCGRSTKKYSRKGKLNDKNSCTPINPKKYSCYGLKKIHTRNLITKGNSCGSKIPLSPPPPHNFSNGPSPNSDEKPRSVHLPPILEYLLYRPSKPLHTEKAGSEGTEMASKVARQE